MDHCKKSEIKTVFGILLFFSLLTAGIFLFATVTVRAQSQTIDIDALVEGCGDALIQSGESCDGSNLNGQTCASVGFTTGTLSCSLSCTFDTSLCTLSSGGGGGGGGSSSSKKGAQIVLTGRAYPRSEVTILKDAQIVATTIADDNATFQVGVQGLSAGTYIFSVYGEDGSGVRSSLLTFPVTVTKGILAKIESIFVAPTLAGDKVEVKRGDSIQLFGQTFPHSAITLEVNSPQQFFVKAAADDDGVYLYNFDSSVLEMGEHHAKSRASTENVISSQSAAVEFLVGTKNVFSQNKNKCSPKADFNKDCKVNLVDFSIAAFWYNRTLSADFLVREKEHVNGDGKINLVDFSIMAFYWTG